MGEQVELYAEVPDFGLRDHEGNLVRLSDFRGCKHVLLVLNRGFI